MDTFKRLKVIRRLARNRTIKFNGLLKLLASKDLLIAAYEKIKSKPGSMTQGIDEITLDKIKIDELDKLSQDLINGNFTFKPARRIYIPKPGKKEKRPLGIPSPRDKIVQQAIAIILESIYEPTFSVNSHGFRPSLGCLTALHQIKKTFIGSDWVVEGDIRQCFPSVDHDILMKLLRKRIQDEQFLAIIYQALKVGYIERKPMIIKSFLGMPQGSVVSPILMNIYMHELDRFMDQISNQYYVKGRAPRVVGARKLETAISNLNIWLRGHPKKAVKDSNNNMLWKTYLTSRKQVKTLRAEKMKLNRSYSYKEDGSLSRAQVRYVRYADDFVIGVLGPKWLASEIKERIRVFLKETLNLDLSPEKTKITNVRKERVLFLGYHFKIGTNRKRIKGKRLDPSGTVTPFSKLSTGHFIRLLAPMDRILDRLKTKGFINNNSSPKSKPDWTVHRDELIVAKYNSVLRGIINFYSGVDDPHSLGFVQYLLQYSCAMTLAHKHKSSVSKIFNKWGKSIKVPYFKVKEDPAGFITKTSVPNYAELRLEKSFSRERFAVLFAINMPKVQLIDPIDVHLSHRSASRLDVNICSVCGAIGNIEMHHIRHVKDKKDDNRRIPRSTGFNRLMGLINRKQIPVCANCHDAIHAGLYNGLRLRDLQNLEGVYTHKTPDFVKEQVRIKKKGEVWETVDFIP